MEQVFDSGMAGQLKDEGMSAAAFNQQERLELARDIAITIAKSGDGFCNADQVGKVLLSKYGIESLGPAAGSMFKTPDWHFSGVYVPSERVKSHGQVLRVWRYVGP